MYSSSNKSSFFWLIATIIFVFAISNDQDRRPAPPDPTPEPTTFEQETTIVNVLLSPEKREQFCSQKSKVGIAHNGDLLLIECIVEIEGKTFTLHYTPIGDVFTIIDSNGSVMGDNLMNGEVNFAQTSTEEKTYKNFPNFKPSGENFRTEWQTLFEHHVQVIYDHNQKKSDRMQRPDFFMCISSKRKN